MPKLRQTSFRAGEWAETVSNRSDLDAYPHALARCRGFIIGKHGQAVNRPGTIYGDAIGEEAHRARLIPFKFGGGQNFALEFGVGYLRFWQGGALVLNAGVPYEVATPYAEADLRRILYSQSGDVVTLTCKGYAQRELRRYSNTNWTLTIISFAIPATDLPTEPTPAQASITYDLGESVSAEKRIVHYAVTALVKETATGRVWETLPWEFKDRAWVRDTTIDAWAAGTTYAALDLVRGSNEGIYRSAQSANTGHDPTTSPTWWTPLRVGMYPTIDTAGRRIDDGYGTAFSLVEQKPLIRWAGLALPAGTTLLYYQLYRGRDGVFGLLAATTETQWTDDGTLDPDYALSPPTGENPFSTDWPAASAFFEQRRVFAGTAAAPGDVLASRLGDFYNHSAREHVLADDAFRLTLASQELEEIRWLLPLRALLAGTGESVFLISGAGGPDEGLSATSYRARLVANIGTGSLPPLKTNRALLLLSPLDNAVHELLFEQASESYQAAELSLLASHLLEGHTIVEWAYQRAPFEAVWGVRDDGILLGLSYVPDLQVLAWHWHDTRGAWESICAVREGNEDVLYGVIRRTIGGTTRRYVERFASRRVSDVRLGVFLDSALEFDGRNAGATTLVVTGASYLVDEFVEVSASADAFVAGDVGNDLILDPDATPRKDGAGKALPALGPVRLRITAFTDARHVTVQVIEPAIPDELQATATTSWARAVDELSGLDHLEGETVSAVADGSLVEGLVVAGGAVTLPIPAAVIRVGLPYVSELETLDIPGDDARTRQKTIKKVFVEVESTNSLEVGRDLDHLTRWEARRVEHGYGPVPLQTREVELAVSGDWSKTGRVALRQRLPYPITVLGITREVEVGGS